MKTYYILADNGFPIIKLEGPMAEKYYNLITALNPEHLTVDKVTWDDAVKNWLEAKEEGKP